MFFTQVSDDFVLPKDLSDSRLYKQAGNPAVPKLRLAKTLKRH